MAARKSAAKPTPEAAETHDVDAVAEEIVARGGWNLGYVGDRTDPEPDEAYTVAGVTAPPAETGDDE